MTTSPRNWAAIPTPSPSGAAASNGSACRACSIAPAAADRPLFPPQDKHKVLALATTPPADVGVPTSHWSLDDLAFHILQDAHYRDMSRSTIQRILAEADLQPHRCRYWLQSHDPDFEVKTLAICDLYLQALPLYAQGELIISTDEKTSIQALERRHPTLPGRPGQVEKREFEYRRHGTRCLLGSLVVPTGQVIGSVTARRGKWDFVRHVRDVVVQFPQTKRFHWVMDNLNTHWTLELCRYLAKDSGCWTKELEKQWRTGKGRRAFLTSGCSRHMVHFTPKHGSWLNQIEIWFGVLSRRVLRRGSFTAVADLTKKMLDFIAYYNAHFAHPYEWTYTGKPGVSGDGRKRKRFRFRRQQLVNMRSH
jgi:transposase